MGDCRETLRSLETESVQCVVTSPPYWQLRDYGVNGQLGLEPTPQAFVAALVDVFREVRRVLRRDGTAWVNMGDTYQSDSKWGGSTGGKHAKDLHGETIHRARHVTGLPDKSLVGTPWRFALAMQDDGWVLRSDIVWHKPNPMPESVRDRPTRAHEYVFLFAKGQRYYYDAPAIAEPLLHPADSTAEDAARAFSRRRATVPAVRQERATLDAPTPTTKNARSVWSISTSPSGHEHFAAFPRELARRCIAAGTRPGDVVLDPFAGTGTTLEVAITMGRGAIGCEISEEYSRIIERRLRGTQLPLARGAA